MIEDRIKILRRAAQISSKEKNEKVWCVIAGNDRLLDDIAYNAITSKDRAQIIFRETISVDSKYTAKMFDCILLNGEALKISELSNHTREEGGASLEITSSYLKREPNLLVVVGTEDYMKKFVGKLNKNEIRIKIILEDHTTGFINAQLKSSINLPKFIKNTVNPILDTSEVVLSTLLISVEDEKNIDRIKEISQENNLFGIDLKSTIQDKEQNKTENKEENKEKETKENKENKEEKDKNKEKETKENTDKDNKEDSNEDSKKESKDDTKKEESEDNEEKKEKEKITLI